MSLPDVDGLNATSVMVYHLATSLPYQKRAFNITLDNYFSNIPLLTILHEACIGAYGTAHTTSSGLPSQLKMPKNSKLNYHFFTGIICGIVLTVLWMDNAAVTILTTVHQITGREATRVQNRKRPCESSSNATRVKQLYSPDEFEKELPIPTCVVDYNHTMNGVDIANQY